MPVGEQCTDRVNVLGVGIDAITMGDALRTIDSWITRREPHYVCLCNVYGVMEAQRDPVLRMVYNASGLTTPDGMPLVWLCKKLRFPSTERVYGPDLMLALCEHSIERGYRHFFYGGEPGVPEKLVRRLKLRFPDLAVAGTYSPPFRELSDEEDRAVVSMINAARPDILWVGLGAPKQERWMAQHVGLVHAPVLIGVGAAFDFIAGVKKQAPPILRKMCLEWAFRLCTEPRRLWRRYLVNNPLFVFYLTLQLLRIVRYPEPEPVPYEQLRVMLLSEKKPEEGEGQ